MGKTIQVFGFPAGVTAEAVKDFLESKTGGGTVYALKLRTPKKGVGRLYAIVQFTTKEAADTIISLACRTEKLWYGRSYLNARRMEQDTVPRPRTFMHTMEHIELHFGCKISNKKFAVLWRGVNVTVNFGFGMRKINFLLSHLGEEYRLELDYENIWEIELHCPRWQMTKYLLIQLLGAPRIFQKGIRSPDLLYESPVFNFFKEVPDDQWVRTTDFTPSNFIGQSTGLCMELPYRLELPDFKENFAYYKESEDRFVLETGSAYSRSLDLVPIVGPPDGIALPYEILFKINLLVQNGCVAGPLLDSNFYRLVDPYRAPVSISCIEHALDKLYHLKECCYEPSRWLTDQYRKYMTSRSKPSSPAISLDDGLVYVHRVQVTPSRVYFCGPEINVSNRVLRHFRRDIDNFLRISFIDEDLDKIHSTDLSPRGSSATDITRTRIYTRILSTLRNGILIGDRKFEFLAFSSSQLRESSAWMFASRYGLTAAEIREWMGNFREIRNVAKYAARLGQSFSSSKETLSVHMDEMEIIPDVKIEIGKTKYVFSDGIGKVSAEFARKVASKCGLKDNPPSAFQIRYGGYKGVVAADPTSSKKLSLRDSMRKYESELTKLDVLAWSKYQPCFLNRQLISLLSTLGIWDEIFEKKQREAVRQLDAILTDPLKAQEALELMSPGENTNILKELLICGYKPDAEPFLSMMLQTFRASKLLELRTKTRIFIPNGRSMMGCLDETRTLNYGQVFVQISGAGYRQLHGESSLFSSSRSRQRFTQGPLEHVEQFFISMGFKCPKRKGIADFLQEVTSRKDQEQYWVRNDEPYRFVTVKEFVHAFQSFHVGRKLGDELGIPFDKKNSHPAALTTRKYGVGKKELLKACFSREHLLMKRNSFVYIFRLTQVMFLAVIGMTIFLRTKMHRDSLTDGVIYTGALFFILTTITFNGMAEISMTVAKLPVFYKQRDLQFYPSWAYALPAWILKIPISIVEVSVWVFMTYYVIGFDSNAGRFFKQYLLLLIVNQMSSAMFRLIAAAGRSMVVANTFGSLVLLLLFVLGGFVLSRDDIKKWWKWGYWCSPLMYAQNAIVVNEFLGNSWKKILPNKTKPLGIEVLDSRGFFTDAYWYWLGVGALTGFIILFQFGFTLALSFLNPFGTSKAFISEESQSTEHDSRTGGTVQLSTCANSSSHITRSESRDYVRRRNSSSQSRETTIETDQPKNRGMVLPFEPFSLTFDEITYSVDMPQEMKRRGVHDDKLVLLNGVSGAFRPGVLTALMGVTGSGKTTLMDVLAGRKTRGYITGNITISGYPKKQETFTRISGYCEQNDIHSPYVTVYESLLYSAWLRLSSEVNSKTREMFVEEVMELVELNPLRQALVGLPGVNGLSTEQRKRLTIAVELVANPSIIFMDEPTSGLDARAAAVVMRTVRNTVDTGRTVVCTIHQPSIDIFEAFDALFLLKRGGQEIYVGPLGHHSSHLIKYFEGIPGVSKIRDGYNPATWMLEVTAPSQEIALGVDFAAIYKSSELYRINKALIQELSKPAPGSKELYFANQYPLSFFTQCMACLWKQHWSYSRNPHYTAVRFLFTIFISLIFGTMFWDMGTKTTKQQDLFNTMGFMYVAVYFLGVLNVSSVQPVVDLERSVFYREKGAGMYSPMAYAFAQVLIEIPYIFVQAAPYSLIVYAMIGFEWTAAKFFWFLFFMFFSLLYFTFFGMMLVAWTPNHHIASIVSTLFYGLWNIVSGFIIPRTRIPVWWRWSYWANPIAWTLYGFFASQFGDVQDRLESGETVKQFLRSYYGFKHDFLGAVAAVVFVLPSLFAFVFALGIRVLNFQKR